MNGVSNAARLLAEHGEDRELWLAYYSTIFKRFLFSIANAGDQVDLVIAAGIALEDITTIEEKIFGQSAGSLSTDYLKPV